MNMTNEEIVREFTQAANKSKQIKILADLNCVTPGEIRQVLAAAGVEGVKAPERIVRRRDSAAARPAAGCEAEGAGQNAVRPAEAWPDIYTRIETILGAIPEGASEYMISNALNLVQSMFSDYVLKRMKGDG